MVEFPLSPVPSYYTTVTPGQAKGIFYFGGTAPFVTLNKSGATGYTVRDYNGNVVSTGTVSGLTVTPTAPVGGWLRGWYRIYFTGPSTDTLFGPAYGSSIFMVINNDTRFPGFTVGGTDNGANNVAAKGALGMGAARGQIGAANSPTSGSLNLALMQAEAALANTNWTVPSNNAYYDSARTRYQWCAFPNGTSDSIAIGGLRVNFKTGAVASGTTVTATTVAGSSSGTKLTVNGETYDNLASADAAVIALAASSLVVGFGSGSLPITAAQVIGNSYFNGVQSTVAALYPSGVTRFEGPSNEPLLTAEIAHRMRLFQAAVHAGNSSAIAIGPCPVDISNLNGWRAFLDAGGGAYCDEISFHAYNAQTNGDINLGRAQISAFLAMLASYGLSSKVLWQTESTQAMINIYGVFHPRRARLPLLETLLWEQYGVPRERNNIWYDAGHGFWSFPTWWLNEDDTLNPECVLYRTLAEETFGQVHSQALSFGTFGDRVWLGSLYAGASSSSLVIQMTSYMPGATVTLSVTGTSSLTVVDGFGNTSTVAVTKGQATISTSDIPTYVRLPIGVTATVYSCNDWPPINKNGAWSGNAFGCATTPNSGAMTPVSVLADNQWIFSYGGSDNGVGHGTSVPDTASIAWPTATRVDRVLIWSGIVWQLDSTLATFTVETSVDGITWVVQQTVDVSSGMTSFQFGADSVSTGCQRETYWPEQYIFDVKLPAPVVCKAIRINVSATSYGGEPDAACVTTGGQGSTPGLTLQEIVPLCDDNALYKHFPTIH